MEWLAILQEQCDEVEKIVQDVKVETVDSGNDSLESLVEGLEENVIAMSRMLDKLKNKILGE